MIRVGVLRGGKCKEFQESLKNGEVVLSAIDREKYEPIDLLIDQDGVLHMRGLAIEEESLPRRVDVIWNALLGTYGGDGKMSQYLSALGVPHTSETPFTSSLTVHNRNAKQNAQNAGFEVPNDIVVPDYRDETEDPELYIREAVNFIFQKLPPPWILKPLRSTSTHGVIVAKSIDGLARGLATLMDEPTDVLVEEYIDGRDAKVITTNDFHNQDTYAFLPVEMVGVSDGTYHTERSSFSQGEREELALRAVQMHELFGVKSFAETHFIVSPKGIYFVGMNPQPSLRSENALAQALTPVGSSIKEFISHVIGLALNRK